MYDNDFFRKFPQQWTSFHNDDDAEMRYEFPTFYEACRGMMGIFTCSFGKAQALLPSKRLLPIPGGIGRALVVVGAFEYLHPKGMDPYNELLFAFPVVHLRAGKLPASGLAMQQLIVDVPENIQRGKHVWGMNKSLGELKFSNESDLRVCEVFRNGRRAVRFEVPRQGRSRRFEECRALISAKNGEVLRAHSCMTGRRIDAGRGAALTLGADPFAVELQALEISAAPLRASFLPSYDQAVGLPQEAEAA